MENEWIWVIIEGKNDSPTSLFKADTITGLLWRCYMHDILYWKTSSLRNPNPIYWRQLPISENGSK